LFPYVTAAAAVTSALSVSALPAELSLSQMIRCLTAAALLPLFPLHGIYVAALTRTRGCIAVCLAVLLPAAGLYATRDLLQQMPADFLTGIRMLGLFGALYGSLKALTQSRVIPLLAYAGLSFYSVLWWHIAGTAALHPQAVAYFGAVVLITAGLAAAWCRVQARYGDLVLDRIGGLARPMPHFATLFALLVMAAVGLPPFGLFSGYIGMLLYAAGNISWDLNIVLFTWLAASFYFFRMMQQLLFGPHRTDIPYRDLDGRETVSIIVLLLMLVALGLLPFGSGGSDPLASGYRSALEMTAPWIK
jgi:NADH-quinone oxidoreductase subunit M